MLSFMKDNGYVWESGLAGHYTYGPNGKKLKNNIENYLRDYYDDLGFNEVDTPLILKKEVWENSGHWNKFRDPLVYTYDNENDDPVPKVGRLDKLIECYYPNVIFEDLSIEEIRNYIDKINDSEAPYGFMYSYHLNKKPEKGEYIDTIDHVEYKDLMMKTYSGEQEAGLRPETATATFNNYKELFAFNHNQFPVKAYQIGKSFRNEISPRNNIIRGREFTQAEFQIFLPENIKNINVTDDYNDDEGLIVNVKRGTANQKENIWNLNIHSRYYHQIIFLNYKLFLELGIPQDKLRLRQHAENERAFYALDAWDLEICLSELGWTEIAGIHDRGTYDLRNEIFKKNRPHIIEIAIGIDRLLYSIIDTLYEKKDKDDGKSILKLPNSLAITQLAVLPLVSNNEDIMNISKNVFQNLKKTFRTIFLPKQSIGKRYLKCSEIGIPYCITIDYDTLQDNMVTIRFRDTEKQIRVEISELQTILSDLI